MGNRVFVRVLSSSSQPCGALVLPSEQDFIGLIGVNDSRLAARPISTARWGT